MKILNLHGLLGHSENFNYHVIKDNFDCEIISPQIDYTESPSSIFKKLNDNYDLIVANSFGGFFGYVLGLGVPTILCNPCIPPYKYILNFINDYKYVDELKDYWEIYKGQNKKVTLILGMNDDVIDPYLTLEELEGVVPYTVDEGHKLKSKTFESILKHEVSKCIEF